MNTKQRNKILSRHYRIQCIHNDLFLLNKNPKQLEYSDALEKCIKRAIRLSSKYTQFAIIENLHSLALKHEVVMMYVNQVNINKHLHVPAYDDVLTFKEKNGGIQELVWEDKGEEFADLIAKAIREVREHLSFIGLSKLVNLVELTRERDKHEQDRIKAFGTFNALCDKDTQKALVNNVDKLVLSSRAKQSLKKGFKDLCERINNHKLNRRK